MTHLEDRGPTPDCRDVLQSLLVADPKALSGSDDDELGRHLATCDRCRQAARQVLDGQGILDDWLQSRVAGRSVDRVLERVHAEVREAPQPADDARDRTVRRPRRAILTLAMAAALAAIALWATRGGEEIPTTAPALLTQPIPTPPGGTVAPRSEGITVSADRRFALLETGRPTISVVWFY